MVFVCPSGNVLNPRKTARGLIARGEKMQVENGDDGECTVTGDERHTRLHTLAENIKSCLADADSLGLLQVGINLDLALNDVRESAVLLGTSNTE